MQSLTRELSECKAQISRVCGELEDKDRLIKEKDRAIVQLRRELIDVDSQLDSERRRLASIQRADVTKPAPDKDALREEGMRQGYTGSVVIPSVQREGEMSRLPQTASHAPTTTETVGASQTRGHSTRSDQGSVDHATQRKFMSPQRPTSVGISTREKSPTKAPHTAAYAATTVSYRSGRETVGNESTSQQGGSVSAAVVSGSAGVTSSRATSRVRTIRSSSTLSSSRNREINVDPLERGAPGRVIPVWRDIEPQDDGVSRVGREGARDISPVFPRRSSGGKTAGLR